MTQHLSLAEACRTLLGFVRSGAKLLLLTTHLPDGPAGLGFENFELDRAFESRVTGTFYPQNLQLPPFNLGPPLQLWLDNPVPGDPGVEIETTSYLGLWEADRIRRRIQEGKVPVCADSAAMGPHNASKLNDERRLFKGTFDFEYLKWMAP
jgi:hypothetical protein